MRAHDRESGAAIGRVRNTGPRGVLVVATTGDPPRLGTRLVTEDGRRAGVVVDVIGHVDRPLLVVSPPRHGKGRPGQRPRKGPDPEALVGAALYPR